MTSETCIVVGCKKDPLVHIHRAWNHRIGQEARVCADHVDDFLNRYYEMPTVGVGASLSWRDAVVFDIEMVMYDERQDKPCQFSLREIGGSRRLDCRTGPFEAAALLRELERLVAPRPSTHCAMVSVMATLGGRLDRVLVDKLLPGERTYEAKLQIHQAAGAVVVDVRISDAVILAVICDVPIFVSNEVLAHLTDA
jgi:bifunctional DNase/RNase